MTISKPVVKPVSLENVRIGFRNFEGREGQYNRKGDRSFAIFLNREIADELAAEGWNVKYPKPSAGRVDPDEDERDPFLQVSVGFDAYPANVFLIANGEASKITGDEVKMLDWAEIENVDVVIRPYEWSVNGSTGIKAYLKSGYFSIIVDNFAAKYGV
jgi:hypothetical protein